MKYLGIGVTFLGLVVGLALIFAYPTMWFVNYLIAPHILAWLFGVPQINVWQALSLNFVCGLLKSSTTVNTK